MIFFSTPFKQLATGMEKFRPLLFMAVCSNVLRSIALILFAFMNQFSLETVVITFIARDLAELLLCIFIMQYFIKVLVTLRWNGHEYQGLIKEALPQFGVAIFTSALSRLDWIFLGQPDRQHVRRFWTVALHQGCPIARICTVFFHRHDQISLPRTPLVMAFASHRQASEDAE